MPVHLPIGTTIIGVRVPGSTVAEVGSTVWVCSGCEYAVEGDEHAANPHLEAIETASHWLFEFRYISPFTCEPTGREIHSADEEGKYYLSAYDSYSFEYVYQSIANRHIRRAIDAARARTASQ